MAKDPNSPSVDVSPEIRELLAKRTAIDAQRHATEAELHKHFAAIDEIDAQLIKAGFVIDTMCW